MSRDTLVNQLLVINDALVEAITAYRAVSNTRIAALEDTIKTAATRSEFDSTPCPLCTYKDGYFVRACAPHERIDELEATITCLEAAIGVIPLTLLRGAILLRDVEACRAYGVRMETNAREMLQRAERAEARATRAELREKELETLFAKERK